MRRRRARRRWALRDLLVALSGPAESRRSATSFEEVAELYDRYRPAPPGAVVDAIIALAAIGPTTRVVELACGTGQLSVALAATGAALTCVEPGAHLSALAARNLARFENAHVERATFEQWVAPAPFDAAVVANAFHWFDPEVRLTKPAAMLGSGGRFAILHTHHVRGGTAGFVEAAQHAYLHAGLADDLSFLPPRPEDLRPSYTELDAVPAYSSVRRERFEIASTYTADQYTGWLRTDSLVNTLPDDAAKQRFLDEIATLVDSFGGSVTRAFVYELIVATKR